MAPKKEKVAIPIPIPVVELDSDDDNGGAGVTTRQNQKNKNPSASKPPPPPSPQKAPPQQPSVPDYQTLDSRSFWKAGDYAVGPTIRPTTSHGELEHARVHPKFLHSNATSHKWAFGAIAELLDNAVDEVQNGATFVRVDKIDVVKDNSPALLFQDDGGGMDPEGMRKCMSLGYSTKKANTTIGQYGNGFKTSTMRLGADVIVFSRAIHEGKATQSVGLLSYTFLRRTGQDDVIVPMVDFDITGNWVEPVIYGSQDDWTSNLNTILEWSPFASKEDLMQQFEEIGSHGTRIIIYNLWLNDEGIYELSFDDDNEDIRLRDESRISLTKPTKKIDLLLSHISYRMRYSLRAYASILYLRRFKNFKIILRGKPVQQYYIKDDLIHSEVKTYRPQLATTLNEVTVETTIGFVKGAPAIAVNGFNVYHKNRLIRPFWKVMADGSSKGNGVVGVLEANFIEPAHDKQDFERSALFIRLETRMKQMVKEYWKSKCHFVGYQPIGVRNPPKERTVKLFVGVTLNERNLDQTIGANAVQNDSPTMSDEVVMSADTMEPMSVDEICDENIQLFMRCETQAQKETELKQTVENLEKELEMAKRKRAQLALYLETKKKQKLMQQPTEMA